MEMSIRFGDADPENFVFHAYEMRKNVLKKAEEAEETWKRSKSLHQNCKAGRTGNASPLA